MARKPGPTVNAALASALGARIRDRRKALVLTLDALAGKANLSKTFISQLENGHSVPAADSVLALAHALGVRPGWLIEGDPGGADVPTQPPTEIPASLARYAADNGLSFRAVGSLIGVAKVLGADDRGFDWARLHGALKPWLD